jgi:multiple sugar transport system permease protein
MPPAVHWTAQPRWHPGRTPIDPPAGPQERRNTLARSTRRGAPALFLTPFFLLFLAFTVAPLGYAAWISLFREESSGLGFGGSHNVFVGLGNYAGALRDSSFRGSFFNIIGYCLVYIPVMIIAALLLALLLDSAYAKAKRFFQLALFVPHTVPGLIAAIIWVFLYTPGLSPVVSALGSAGLHWNFLATGHIVTSVAAIAVWEWLGYNMVIFFAALQAVPRDVLEAATVDGAGGIRTALQIKLPLISSAVSLATLFTGIGAIQLFTEPQIMEKSGSAVSGTWSPNMYAFTATSQQHQGLAAAAALLIAIFAAALSFLVTRISTGRRPR